MPIPFILGGIAIAAGVTGVAAGAQGAKKISEAKTIVDQAEGRYNQFKRKLDNVEMETLKKLDGLGKLKVLVWKDFETFSSAFEKIKNRPEFEQKTTGTFKMPKHSLGEIKEIQIHALEILGTTAASAGAGVATGFAAYSGVMALGSASTGTAISSLSGAAATKAAMAALGGGSIASGGGGIALGAQVLTGAVAGPVIAVGGLLINAKGNSSLEKAGEVRREVDSAVSMMESATNYLTQLGRLTRQFHMDLSEIHQVYLGEVQKLVELVNDKTDYKLYTTDEKVIVDNNIKLISILYKLSNQDLIRQSESKTKLPEILTHEVEELLGRSKEAVESLEYTT
ncbi:hypothetical protein [Exiguobacterium sp. s157]|uniref:hypothetical protein n=1 Tax=Exiguobacterium sp. s157 TaxID=2751233 RepID=UPI001BE57589|nr:hypothetical protein [Exiguobacterium sp. s157]